MDTMDTPHCEESERSVVSAVLQNPELLRSVRPIADKCFFAPPNRLMWRTICGLHDDGDPVDAVTVSTALRDAGRLDDVGGAGGIASYLDFNPAPSTATHHAERVRMDSLRRELERIGSDASNPDTDFPAIVDRLDAIKGKIGSAGLADEGLPPIRSAKDLLSDPPPMPVELVEGLIHHGTKTILGGGSKSYKTWSLMDLAVSVATGSEWMGFKCRQSRVLYVDLEVQTPVSAGRFQAIAKAKGAKGVGTLDIWNLHAHAADIVAMEAHLTTAAMGYHMVILDPIYKLLGDRDENSNGAIADMLNHLSRIMARTGAAVVFAHHFAKGNASGKYAIDRMSGAGSWARDPDTIITLSPHEEEDALVAEFILRNLPRVEPFVLRREHPLMVRDGLLDPEKLREPGKKPSRTVAEILSVMPPENKGIRASEWQELCHDELGIGSSTFYKLLKRARKSDVFQSEIDKGYYRK